MNRLHRPNRAAGRASLALALAGRRCRRPAARRSGRTTTTTTTSRRRRRSPGGGRAGGPEDRLPPRGRPRAGVQRPRRARPVPRVAREPRGGRRRVPEGGRRLRAEGLGPGPRQARPGPARRSPSGGWPRRSTAWAGSPRPSRITSRRLKLAPNDPKVWNDAGYSYYLQNRLRRRRADAQDGRLARPEQPARPDEPRA